MKQVAGIFLPDSDLYFTPILERTGSFELAHLNEALKYVKNWRVAVDAGAHCGLWTRTMAACFEKVIAIEPDGANYSCLLRNTDALPNVYPYKFALSNEDGGEVTMRESAIRVGNSGSHYCVPGRGIPTRTLDSLELDDVSFLKIDCEGYEPLVVAGGRETILRCRPIILLEEKHFKDREGRLGIDYRAAGLLLEEWGMKRETQIGRDVVFAWN